MSLEACMIIVDNSEYTRNGDFAPSRFQSQLDAVSIMTRNKTGSNAESSVGLVDTAGPTCHMSLVTDADLEKLLASLHRIDIKGEIKLVSAVNVAMLALKHRINKRLEQRVICFVGSPVSETPEELTSLGTRMKKNKVAIDIVSFGEVAENEVKLQALVNAANSGDNSHYTGVATKPYVNLMDELTGSAVFGASMAMAGSAMDDDLETAIRLSLAEQGGGAAAGGAAAGGAAPRNQMAVDDVDDEMAAAIRMSMAGAAPEPGTENNNQAGAGAGDIDEDLELAIQLSMQDNMDVDEPAPTPAAEEPKKKEEETAAPKEEESTGATMQSLMESIGVDPNDPNFQQLMADLDKEKESEEKRDDKSKK